MLNALFMREKRETVDISMYSVVMTLSVIGIVYGLYYVRSTLLMLFVSFILMVAINPLVQFLSERTKFPRMLSISIVYILLLLVVSLAVALIVPPLISEVTVLFKTIPIPILQEQVAELKFTVQEWNTVIERVGNSLPLLFRVISTTFNGLFGFVTLLVISFYLLVERPVLYKKIGWFTREKKHFETARYFIDELEVQLGGWVRAELILMLSIGIITYFSLVVLSIPYALPLAIIAGTLELLPNLGPTISAVPAILVAYITFGPVMAGIMILLYIVIQQIENSVLVPHIMKSNANVDPLVAILLILIGFELGSVVGALLAIPMYIVFRLAFTMVRGAVSE